VLAGTDYGLSAHHQQDPRSLPQGEGCGRRGHHDQLHAVRSCRLADHRGRHQEVRLGRQEDRRRLHHQRRRQTWPFYKELGNKGIKAKDIPVVAFSVGEEELAGLDTKPLVGHLAAWNYFQSIKDKGNEEFIAKWKALHQEPEGAPPTIRWKPM